MKPNLKTIQRKTLVDTKYLKVFEDTIKLPSGQIIDYTFTKKPDIVMIVATDKQNRLVLIKEYSYGPKKLLLSLPAGHLKKGENAETAGKRELLEETGYTGDDFKFLGILYDYPSKDLHNVSVVRALNVKKVSDTKHEETENIKIQLINKNKLNELIIKNKFQISSAVAAIALSNI